MSTQTANASRALGLLSDDTLIAYCKAGQRPAWDALLNRYQGYIFRFTLHLCHNQADAEDITARTLLRIYQSLHTFRDESSFSAWITRIAYNLFLDSNRHARYKATLSLDTVLNTEESAISGIDLSDPRPTPEQHFLDQAAVENVQRAIQHLPGYMRGCLKMHLQGYSYEQMAEALGVSLGTVKSRISRARSMLRVRLVS